MDYKAHPIMISNHTKAQISKQREYVFGKTNAIQSLKIKNKTINVNEPKIDFKETSNRSNSYQDQD